MKAATKSAYVGVRLEPDLMARIDALAKGFIGLKVPISDVVRLAIAKGLTVMERENKAKKK